MTVGITETMNTSRRFHLSVLLLAAGLLQASWAQGAARADDGLATPSFLALQEQSLLDFPEEVEPLPEIPGPLPLESDLVAPVDEIPPVVWDTPVVVERPGPLARVLEAPANLLTCPNEWCGNCLARVLRSPRVEVPTELDDFPLGLQPISVRPPLLVECGERFLSPGFLKQGIETPCGAVWRPALWVFGEFRSAMQTADQPPAEPVAEWASRLDLFGQLNLSGTERFLLGLRPLDKELSDRRVFTGYDFRNGNGINGLNAQIQTGFFEGDIGELMPFLDPYDTQHLDYGFSVGRMPLLAQQGLLINEDRVDAVTLTRNTLYSERNLNLRITGVYAWGSINRNSPFTGVPNTEDAGSHLVAMLTESDIARSTVNVDAVYVNADDPYGELAALGVSGIQRCEGLCHTYNTSLHLLASFPVNGATEFAQQGELLFAQTSWTPHHYEDLIYVNAFWAIDQFTSPARGPLQGGPLGQTGLLFSAPGLGRIGPPINVRTNDTIGGSLGYQFFFADTRQQVVWEIGGQKETSGANSGTIATGLRYQRALDQHWIAILDTFAGKQEVLRATAGIRLELRSKF